MRHKIADNVSCRFRRMNSVRYCVKRTAWKTMYDGASSPTRVPPRSPVQYSLLDIPTASVRGRQVLDLLTVFVNIPRCITLGWEYSVKAFSDLKLNINTVLFSSSTSSQKSLQEIKCEKMLGGASAGVCLFPLVKSSCGTLLVGEDATAGESCRLLSTSMAALVQN